MHQLANFLDNNYNKANNLPTIIQDKCKIYDYNRLINDKQLMQLLSNKDNYLNCYKQALTHNLSLSENLIESDIVNYDNRREEEINFYFKNINNYHRIFKKIILKTDFIIINKIKQNFEYPERSIEYFILEKIIENKNLDENSIII